MTPEDRITLAGELALGLLDGDDRATAQRLVLADPAFARLVENWRRHFATLFAEWPDAVPGDMIEKRILAIDTPAGAVVPMADAGRWRWIAAGSSAIAACLLVAIALRPERVVERVVPAPVVAAAPPLVAAITPTAPAGAAAKPFAVVYDERLGEVRLAGGPVVPTGRSAQLWTIGGDGVPRPMGLLGATTGSRIAIAMADRPRFAPGTTLAISIEPLGGSPTGLPTGPVVATGLLTRA